MIFASVLGVSTSYKGGVTEIDDFDTAVTGCFLVDLSKDITGKPSDATSGFAVLETFSQNGDGSTLSGNRTQRLFHRTQNKFWIRFRTGSGGWSATWQKYEGTSV